MDSEFHYYIVGILARAAGFDEEGARTIAYASQHVDDNNFILEVKDRSSGEIYKNYISQTMDITKPKKKLMRIYPIFHFVPGEPRADSARRRDGKMHILNTTPNSDLANELLGQAFKAPQDIRPYRIGIASHAYADTWAHQNYVGIDDSFNGDILNPIPNVGHAEDLQHPDWIGHRWEDDRLVESDINNNTRFIQAAKALFEHFAGHLNSKARWEDLEEDMISVMGRAKRGAFNQGQDERMRRYAELAPWLPEYDEEEWINQAMDWEVRGGKDTQGGLTLFEDKFSWKEGSNPQDTHWFRFQEAVKEHQAYALLPVNELCAWMGLDITSL
ncbi:MAG: hypothetical protein JW718_11190 [Desulfovibrionaceae bacterium]|nr:hypothetical protein [Desulfovibrionaceae bacterium]